MRRLTCAIGVVLGLSACGSPATPVTAPTSTLRSDSTVRPTTGKAPDCPAASLAVTSTRGETLHPAWLPPGYARIQGNENQLGAIGDVEYAPGTGDKPRVELLRYRTTKPLSQLFTGAPQPTDVQGHPGILSVGVPMPQYTALLWRPQPGVALVVNGYKLPRADLRKVAENVRYTPGSEFSYPAHAAISVTRDQALGALGPANGPKQAALTSLGEISAIAAAADRADIRSTLAPGLPVTELVWVAWRRPPRPGVVSGGALVVDAQSGKTIATIPHIGSRPLDRVTDRGTPACVPPIGVLTRSEATFLEHPQPGVTTLIKLATQGTIAKYESTGLTQCDLPTTCDESVPIWVSIQIAPDHRFVNEEDGPVGHPKITKPGSFAINLMDARTGPQNTNFGGELGPGRPSARQLALPDLLP